MSLASLRVQRSQLLALQVQVDQQLAAVEAAIRVHGVMVGRPREPYTMTVDEAREMHRRYNAGERLPVVIIGNREYKRRNTRINRAKKGFVDTATVESETKRGPDRANESGPLATVSTIPKGA